MKTTGNQSVKIIPLAGLEQMGMNNTAFDYEVSIIVVDRSEEPRVAKE